MSSINNTISGNTISQNTGGQGGRGSQHVSGGAGGIGCGIYLTASINNTISRNTISQNRGGQAGGGGYWYQGPSVPGLGYGVYSSFNSTSTIHYNNLFGNKNGDLTKGFGVYHDGSSGTISATLNYWGANSGPYHGTSNPSGQGDKVSDWVDYRLYLTGTFTGPNISVVPTSGLIDTTITVEGIAFESNKTISISFCTHLTITTTQSSINGTFSTTFIVSIQLPGTKVITATDTEGNLATTTFYLLPPTFLRIIPSSNVIARGQEFNVDVRIDDIRDLAAAQVYLLFDPNTLEVKNITSGPFPPSSMNTYNTNTSGCIYYLAGLLTDSASGSGILFSATFKGKEQGTSSLKFGNNTILANTMSQSIPFNKDEGLIYVAESIRVYPENKTIRAGDVQDYIAEAICGQETVNVTGSTTFTSQGGGSWTTNSFLAKYIGTWTITGEFLGLIGATSVIITPGTPTTLLYISGNNQTANCTETLEYPFVVKVEDSYNNPCPDVLIDFVITGNPIGATGYVLSTTTTKTNTNGTASSYLTLGTEPPGSYTIEARNANLSGSPIIFTAYSLRRFGNISGTCLIDRGTESQKQSGILVRLIETGETKTTNQDSYFIFTDIPVGTYTLAFTYLGATPATKTDVLITKTQF
ncbi:TPA: hypothetical protein DCX16_04890, partial [bacterium]|nr:hypothetical protein [bacterium]